MSYLRLALYSRHCAVSIREAQWAGQSRRLQYLTKCTFSTWHIEGDRGSAVMTAMDLSGTGAGQVLWPPQLEEVVFSTQRLAMRGKDLRGPFFLQYAH